MAVGEPIRTTLLVAGATLREALRQRGAVAVVAVTVVLLALFALASDQALQAAARPSAGSIDRDVVGATLLGTAAFSDLLLGAFIAVFLSHSTFRGDAERGLLQPVLVRPVPRTAILGGRLLASGSLAAGYALVLWLVSVGVLRVTGGWSPPHWLLPGVALAAAVALVALLSTVVSTVLSAVATGMVTLVLVALGFTAGLLAQLGATLDLPVLGHVADAVSLALPFEALYRYVLGSLSGGLGELARLGVAVGPFGGARGASPLLAPWTIGWAIVVGAFGLWRATVFES